MPFATTIELNNGFKIPSLGLGTYQSEPGEVIQAVKDAIDMGYRHIDCAFLYGNEAEIGIGISEKIADGTVKREDLFITSKLWNTFHSKELVVPMCKKSVKDLGLDYLDLYLIHWPFGFKEGTGSCWPAERGCIQTSEVDYLETWKGMEECVNLKLTKSIGLSNFNSEQIERILCIATIQPVNNQIECNPNLNQKKLIAFCKSKSITVTAYCPLGKAIKSGNNVPLIKNPVILEIGNIHNKTAAQVILRYLVQIGTIPIPKSTNKKRMAENINIFDFELSNEEINKIDQLNNNYRLCPFDQFIDHKYYPFNIEF